MTIGDDYMQFTLWEKSSSFSLRPRKRHVAHWFWLYYIPFLNFWQSFCIPYIKITWEFYSLFRLVIKYKQIRWVTTKSYFRQNIIHSCLEGSHTVANLGSLLKQWYQQFTNKVHINKYAHEIWMPKAKGPKWEFNSFRYATFMYFLCSSIDQDSRYRRKCRYIPYYLYFNFTSINTLYTSYICLFIPKCGQLQISY